MDASPYLLQWLAEDFTWGGIQLFFKLSQWQRFGGVIALSVVPVLLIQNL